MKSINELNIFMTGAGGPAAVCAFKSLRDKVNEIHMADMDYCSAGLYLVPKNRRHIIPAGKSENFTDVLLKKCINNNIDILIPTVDIELKVLSKSIDKFEKKGIRLLMSSKQSLDITMNKFRLLSHVNQYVNVGQFDMLSDSNAQNWKGKKVVIKPVSGSGSRGVEIYDRYESIPAERFDDSELMIQEYAQGPEYSIDIMVSKDGTIKAAIPRVRMRIDSGVSMTGKTEHNIEVINYVEKVLSNLGLYYCANVQVILTTEHGPRLIEINPRFSGGLSLVIKSGADTPLMSIKECIGEKVNRVESFKEIAMVRTFEETYINHEDLLMAS